MDIIFRHSVITTGNMCVCSMAKVSWSTPACHFGAL